MGRKRNKKKPTSFTNPQEEVEDEYDSTRIVKINILWKKMMTMTPLQLLGQ